MNRRILFLVFGITLMVTMGTSSLVPALPAITEHFSVPFAYSGFVVAAFALPGLLCIPLAGVLADRYGRKAVLLPALILFTLGGLSCMAATSFTHLIFFRILQGIGAAPLGILYNTIIADTWTGPERIRMMSYNAMLLGIGTAVSPAFGGILTQLGWQHAFLLSLLGVPVFCLGASISLMQPTLPVSLRTYLLNFFSCLYAGKTVRLLGLSICSSILLFGPIITCFPFLATHFFSATALETGMIMAVASLISGLAAWRLAQLFSRFSARTLLLASITLYAMAFLLMPLMPSLWWLTVPLLFFGFAQGINIPLTALLLTEQAPQEQRAALMATSAVGMRMAQTIAPIGFSAFAAYGGVNSAIYSAIAVAGVMVIVARRI